MKNTLKLIGIIFMVTVIGFTMAACSEEDISDLDGTWISTAPQGNNYIRIAAQNGSFTESMATSKTGTWTDVLRGTYPKDAKSPVTVTVTEVNTFMFGQANKWYSWAGLDSTYKDNMGISQTIKIIISNNKFTVNGVTFQKE